jgi:hypothetical protein
MNEERFTQNKFALVCSYRKPIETAPFKPKIPIFPMMINGYNERLLISAKIIHTQQ